MPDSDNGIKYADPLKVTIELGKPKIKLYLFCIMVKNHQFLYDIAYKKKRKFTSLKLKEAFRKL